MIEVEHHPWKPFLPDACRILMLGSFPPSRKRWCMDFFYPNYINDMWRILGIVFFGDKLYFVDEARKQFILERIIPFLNNYIMLRSCQRLLVHPLLRLHSTTHRELVLLAS